MLTSLFTPSSRPVWQLGGMVVGMYFSGGCFVMSLNLDTGWASLTGTTLSLLAAALTLLLARSALRSYTRHIAGIREHFDKASKLAEETRVALNKSITHWANLPGDIPDGTIVGRVLLRNIDITDTGFVPEPVVTVQVVQKCKHGDWHDVVDAGTSAVLLTEVADHLRRIAMDDAAGQ